MNTRLALVLTGCAIVLGIGILLKKNYSSESTVGSSLYKENPQGSAGHNEQSSERIAKSSSTSQSSNAGMPTSGPSSVANHDRETSTGDKASRNKGVIGKEHDLNSSRTEAEQADASRPNSTETKRKIIEQNTRLFFDTVKVDQTKRQQLLDASLNYQLTDTDIVNEGRAKGLSSQEIAKLRLDELQSFRGALTDLLGESQAKYFMDIRNSAPFAAIAVDFAARCAAAGEPLTPDALAAIRITMMKNMRPSDYISPVIGSNGLPSAENKAFNSAQTTLTQGQLTILKKLWEEKPFPKPGG